MFAQLRHKRPLTAPVSVVIILAAIIPLLITITISQMLSRPQLISQSADAMAQDAHTRVQLIDTYLHDRLHDVQTVGNLYAPQQYALGNTALKPQALNALKVGAQNDVNYDTWSILDLRGHVLLSYPMAPKTHSNQLISPDTLKLIQSNPTNPQISGVFYNPDVGDASIVLYVPILTATANIVGIIRAEVILNYIWNVVNTQGDNAGNYAFILDQNSVRIAYTNSGASTLAHSTYLFKATAPLSPNVQRTIAAEDLYGNNEKPITVLSDPALTRAQNDTSVPSRFEAIPTGQQETYEIVKVQISVVGWTYFALRPLKAVISIADQQLYGTLFIAAIVLVLAIIIGVTTGRRITQPILRSIEQQRQAWEQQHYLNQLKDEILLNVSHELRTPLTEVYGYLELMKVHGDKIDAATSKQFLAHAIDGCEELQLLINSILDTVRTDSQPKVLRLQEVSVAQTVKDVLDLFSPRTLQNYELQIHVSETLSVQADQQYLRQILRNLLSNAFKYTPPHAQILVSATLLEEHAAADDASAVCICVKDCGPGIAPDDIPLLFEKFVRLKRDLSSSIRGIGLGLYISKQLAEAMGGHIWVESTGIAGEGSRFCFTLPCSTHAASPNETHCLP